MRTKNLITLVLLVLSLPVISQNVQRDFAAQLDSSGMYMEQSSRDMYYSLGLGLIAGVGYYWAEKSKADAPTDDHTLKYVITGVLAAGSISFFVAHIVHLNKSGRHMRKASEIFKKQDLKRLTFQTNNDGIGIAFRF